MCTLILAGMILFLGGCGSSYYAKAVEYRETGRLDEGIAWVREKLRDESGALDMFDAHRVVLQFFEALDRLDEGFALYARFRDPALTNYIAGLKFQHEGMHVSATNAFNRALKIRPDEYAIWYDLAVSLTRMGKYKEARQILGRVYRLNDSFAPAIYDMAVLYGYGRNEPAAGMSWLVEALDTYYPFEKNAILDARITLGLFSELSGEWARARDTYEACGPENFARVIRTGDPGEAWARTGNIAHARELWQKALDILGYQNARGRHFFKKFHGSRQGLVDFSEIKFKYATIESRHEDLPRFVFASEQEPVFLTNTWGPMHAVFQKDGMSDLHFGWDTWYVEYVGILSRPQPVQAWIQTRGVVSMTNTRDGLRAYVSLQKSSFDVQVPDRENPGSYKTETFWREGNPKIGLYQGTRLVANFSPVMMHFHSLVVADVDGDGLDDLVSCGFDGAGQLVLDIRVRSGGNWKALAPMTCGLENPANGFVLLDLDNKPGMELVTFSGLISWADVHVLGQHGYQKNNLVFPEFARDFSRRYSFLDQQKINERLYSDKRTAEEKAFVTAIGQYRSIADGIVRESGQ